MVRSRAPAFAMRGFIGPIGDDLPSLVPIVVALLLFFSIFTLTLTTFNTKNTQIQKQMEMTSVARQLKGDSLLLNVDQFAEKCKTVQFQKYPYNFAAGVFPTDADLKLVLEEFKAASTDPTYADGSSVFLTDTSLATGQPKGYFCNYLRVGAYPFTGKENTFFLRYYPVAIQYPILIGGTQQYVIIPGILAMVVWE